jgi:hypothetical protein
MVHPTSMVALALLFACSSKAKSGAGADGHLCSWSLH